VPPEHVEIFIQATHAGKCPKCGGRGPIDVHTSHRVWSLFVLTSFSSRPQVCCDSCARAAMLGDALFCLVCGWWGVPWGLIMTPVQIIRNLVGLVTCRDSSSPSEQLRPLARVQLAKHLLQQPPRGRPVPCNPGPR
jgi:hypothetical protein